MRWWIILLVAAGPGLGQPAEEDEAGRMIQIAGKVAARLEHTPSYTCLETTDRQWYAGERLPRRVTERVRMEVAVVEGREQFGWPGGDQFNDQSLQLIRDRGLTKTGDFYGFLAAIFGTKSRTYEPASEQPHGSTAAIRYAYRVPRSSGYLLSRDRLAAVVGYHGSFWVDRKTLEVTRLEVEADDIPAGLKISSAKMAIDYGTVRVGTGDFLLPQATEARLVSDGIMESRTVTRFSNCRQFGAQSTISFEDKPPAEVGPENKSGIEFPGGVPLSTSLVTPIERKTAAVGDPVEVRLRRAVRIGDGIVIPKGAMVEGRILRLEIHDSWPRPVDLLLLRFTKLRFGEKQVRLQASVIQFGADESAYPWHEIDPGAPITFLGGFEKLNSGFKLTLRTEPAPPPQ